MAGEGGATRGASRGSGGRAGVEAQAVTFRGVTTIAGLAGLLYNVRVPGRATPNTIAVLVHDIEDAPRILGLHTARVAATLDYLRALCVDRDHSSPQPGAFLTLWQIARESRAS